MFSKSTRMLLVAVLALAAWSGIVERRRASTEDRRRLARRALQVDASRVRGLRIETETLRAALVREGDRWTVTEPVRAAADAEAVGRVLLAIERLPRGETITDRDRRRAGARLADYGLDPPRARLVLEGEGAPLALRVGRATPAGDAVYLQVEGTDDVFTVPPGFPGLLPARIDQWRDRALYRGDAVAVRSIDIRRPDSRLRVERGERGGWTVLAPHPARASLAAVAELLGQLLAARIGEFVAGGAVEAAGYGLDETALVVEFGATGLEPAAPLLVGAPVPREPEWHYARFRNGDTVFTVSATLAAQLRAPIEQFRDRRLTAIESSEITAVRLELGDLALHLARRAEGWVMTEPAQAPADPDTVEALVRSWIGAPVERFDDAPADAGEFDPPLGRVLLSRRASAEDATAAEILRVSRHPPVDGRLRVRTSAEPTVFEVPARLVEALAPDPLIYRDRRIFAVEPASVYRLSLVRDGAAQSVRREGAGPFAAEEGGVADDAALRARLERLLRARARRYVAERPADLGRYGLDRPAAELTLDLTGEAGIRKTIQVGRTEGASTYAMIRGRDLVFTVDAATREDLAADLTTGGGAGPAAAGERPALP